MVKLTDSHSVVKGKRKGSNAGNVIKKPKCSDSFGDASIFCELVSNAGISLKDGNTNNEINVNQTTFQKKLSVTLKNHKNYPEIVEDVIEGLQSYILEPKRFRKMLMPTITSADCDSARASIQDSVIHILMGIDILQMQVMNLVLEKLPEITGDDDHCDENGEKLLMPKLLLSQFLWLDKIIDCKSLTARMIEMISITCIDVQREIITCLPDIVEDSEHSTVAKALRDFILESNKLILPVLDALTNLNLSPELITEIRESVLKKLDSIELENLPIVVKFLLQTVSIQDTCEVVREIRRKLVLKTGVTKSSTDSLKKLKHTSEKGFVALILDAIKTGINFHKSVAEGFIKAIEEIRNPNDQKTIDVCILFVIYSTNRRKTVESLFRNKIRTGCFSEDLLHTTLNSHSQALQDFFPSILSLAEVLLRSPEPVINSLACFLYIQCFIVFDALCKQDVIGNLVMHIGSGADDEINSSLDILSHLIENHLKSMIPYAVLVKGVLDYLDNLSITQIRNLYSMLSCLAFYSSAETSPIQDDLHIIIRKQLSSSNPKYKCIGVIGAVMVVKIIAAVGDKGESLNEELSHQVVSLLQLVRNSSSTLPEIFALFMDELSTVLIRGELADKIKEWISDNVTCDFQDDFVVDIEQEKLEKQWFVPMELCLGLNNLEESTIAIDLLPLVIRNAAKDSFIRGTQRIPEPMCLSSHFRLVQVCEKREEDGNLEGIDALLGCPLYTVQRAVVDKISLLSQKVKGAICTTLFHEVNWFIEIVNGFALQSDREMKRKVVYRLQNILDSCKLLEIFLAETTHFKAPLAHFDLEDQKMLSDQSSSSEGSRRLIEKKSEKEDSSDINEICDTSVQNLEGSPSAKESVTTEGNVECKVLSLQANYRHYFRELDMDVFNLLKIVLISEPAVDTDGKNKTDTTELLKLTPPQLNFILKDLTEKLAHALTSPKRRTAFKTKRARHAIFSHLDQYSSKEIAIKVIDLLPSLCTHLEETHAFLQIRLSDDDYMVDGLESERGELETVSAVFKHLIETLFYLFTWNGLLLNENHSLLKRSLTDLVSHVKNKKLRQDSQQYLVRETFQYFKNFSTTITDLETGLMLIELLKALADIDKSKELYPEVATLSNEMLQQKWLRTDGEKAKGAKHNELLKTVIKYYMTYTEDPIKSIEALASKAFPELMEADKNGCSETYKSLTRNSLPVYFNVIFNQLVESSKLISTLKPTENDQLKRDQLIKWNIAVRIHHILVDLLKVFDGRGILGAVLKYGRQFVEVFHRQAMPLLDGMFKFHREDVQSLLKALQLSTRTLHHLCGHSKIIKDVSLTTQVPLMKKALETLVYRVMLMLTVNKCHEAFWMGNLKNRDLQGEEILSQASRIPVNKENTEINLEQDEELNETEPDINMSDDEKESEDASCSEIF
ncbi:hypothetical protein SNE40_021685 [Patella caerulea]|uniref:Fanconi anemia group D2 protein n=1 Tax=Patella caerulea TaxID=87958 RepID=A0AAN8G0G0_PATCE